MKFEDMENLAGFGERRFVFMGEVLGGVSDDVSSKGVEDEEGGSEEEEAAEAEGEHEEASEAIEEEATADRSEVLETIARGLTSVRGKTFRGIMEGLSFDNFTLSVDDLGDEAKGKLVDEMMEQSDKIKEFFSGVSGSWDEIVAEFRGLYERAETLPQGASALLEALDSINFDQFGDIEDEDLRPIVERGAAKFIDDVRAEMQEFAESDDDVDFNQQRFVIKLENGNIIVKFADENIETKFATWIHERHRQIESAAERSAEVDDKVEDFRDAMGGIGGWLISQGILTEDALRGVIDGTGNNPLAVLIVAFVGGRSFVGEGALGNMGPFEGVVLGMLEGQRKSITDTLEKYGVMRPQWGHEEFTQHLATGDDNLEMPDNGVDITFEKEFTIGDTLLKITLNEGDEIIVPRGGVLYRPGIGVPQVVTPDGRVTIGKDSEYTNSRGEIVLTRTIPRGVMIKGKPRIESAPAPAAAESDDEDSEEE